MAAQTFRHAAQLSASGHRLLDRILAMLALLYNAALEERIQAYCRSGKSISLYDQYKSLTEIRQDHADWRAISVLVARSALARLDRNGIQFAVGRVSLFPVELQLIDMVV